MFQGLIDKLKNNFNISKKTSPLIDKVENVDLKTYIQDLANSQSKGKTNRTTRFC